MRLAPTSTGLEENQTMVLGAMKLHSIVSFSTIQMTTCGMTSIAQQPSSDLFVNQKVIFQ